MRPYRKAKEVGKLVAMIQRIERLLESNVPRGGKGHLQEARRCLKRALVVYQKRDRERTLRHVQGQTKEGA